MAYTEEERTRIARVVESARIKHGWGKEQAARQAEISSITWKRVEDGLSVQDVKLAAIETALGWPVGTLQRVINGEEPPLVHGVDEPTLKEQVGQLRLWSSSANFVELVALNIPIRKLADLVVEIGDRAPNPAETLRLIEAITELVRAYNLLVGRMTLDALNGEVGEVDPVEVASGYARLQDQIATGFGGRIKPRSEMIDDLIRSLEGTERRGGSQEVPIDLLGMLRRERAAQREPATGTGAGLSAARDYLEESQKGASEQSLDAHGMPPFDPKEIWAAQHLSDEDASVYPKPPMPEDEPDAEGPEGGA